MILQGCINRRITSSTVVLGCGGGRYVVVVGAVVVVVAAAGAAQVRFLWECWICNGVYPVIRKWHVGVGMTRLANNPTSELFMYPGYRRVVVLAAIMVATMELM